MSTPLPPGFTASPDEPRSPASRPKPASVGPAVVVHHHGVPTWLVVTLVPAALIAATVWHLWTLKPGPPAPPAAEGVRIGRALGPAVAEALAKGFDAAAERIDAGQAVHSADDVLKATFDAQRKAAFASIGGPYLAKIVPSGQEPEGNDGRKAFAEAHRAIAKGLRDAR
ncbi:MAG: hypothetical protein P4L84_37250 [Isosphaeraceae bacterium]|nr:hypothetical protein [Isosphaeraceae bacterium]